jgi:hypothetical protein
VGKKRINVGNKRVQNDQAKAVQSRSDQQVRATARFRPASDLRSVKARLLDEILEVQSEYTPDDPAVAAANIGADAFQN